MRYELHRVQSDDCEVFHLLQLVDDLDCEGEPFVAVNCEMRLFDTEDLSHFNFDVPAIAESWESFEEYCWEEFGYRP